MLSQKSRTRIDRINKGYRILEEMTGDEKGVIKSTEVVYPFTANIYLRNGSVSETSSSSLYCSDNLWRPIGDDLAKVAGLQTGVQCIYNLPDDFSAESESRVEVIGNGDLTEPSLYLKGFTTDLSYESICSFNLPVLHLDSNEALVLLRELLQESGKENTDKSYKQLLDTLSETYNVEIIVIQSGLLEVKLGVVGKTSAVTACKHEFAAIVELIKYKVTAATNKEIDLEMDTLTVDAYSLLPYFQDSRVTAFFKKYMLTTLYPPYFQCHKSTTDNTTSFANPKIFLVGNTRSLLLKSKSKVQETLTEIKKSIFYRSITIMSPGKLQFLKTFRSRQIAQFAVQHQCFIWLEETSIDFQAFSFQLLNQAIKQFSLVFLQDVVELTVYTTGPRETEDLLNKILAVENNNNNNNRELFDSEYLLVKSTGSGTSANTPCSDRLIICTTYSSLVREITLKSNIFTTGQTSASIVQYRVNFEVNQEYEDFICGKKNGKLTRVIDNVSTIVELFINNEKDNNSSSNNRETDDATVITISLVSNEFTDFKTSMTNLIEELPAEFSFFIPEVYHRPIIGSGGAVIQTIMRKHNVFIQFSNSFTMPQNKLAMLRYDNVVIRCPNKNSQNIELARDELLKLVEEFNYVNTSKKLELTSNKLKNILLGRGLTANPTSISTGTGTVSNLSKIVRLERKYNVFINFPLELPPLESNQPTVTFALEISGHESNSISQAVNEIVNDKSLWPQEIKLRMSSNFKNFLQNDEKVVKFYNEVIVPLEETFAPYVWLSYNVPNSDIQIAIADNNNSQGMDGIRDTQNKIINFLTTYLNERGIALIEKTDL